MPVIFFCGWLVGRSVDRKAGWLVDWLFDWLAGQSVYRFPEAEARDPEGEGRDPKAGGRDPEADNWGLGVGILRA